MIKECKLEEIKSCVDLAFKLNSKSESSSAYCSKKYDSIYKDFEHMIKGEEHVVVGYYEADKLVGVMGFFVDVDKHTADCVGPFIDGDRFLDIAKDILDFAKTLLNESTRYNFYFDQRNTDCLELMKLLNANYNGNECSLKLERKNYIPKSIEVNIELITTENSIELIKLHDNIFPGTYVSGTDIINSLGGNRQAYCILEHDVMVGYGVLRLDEGSSNLCVEILAVDEQFRGKGYGKALLSNSLKQAFSNKSIESVYLIVDDPNTVAKNLYFSYGFELEVENQSYSVG